MRIAVLGTGTVGRTLAGRFAELGHDVVVGTRDPAATQQREDSPALPLAGYREAATGADLVVNATSGAASLEVLAACSDALDGVVLLDVANPLDFSQGFPPTLTVANTDSLAEQLQRAHPAARVVKSLNTVNVSVMVDPGRLPEPTHLFLCGDDAAAKAVVADLLGQLGWPAASLLDLGGLRAARGTETYLLLWLSVMSALGTPEFNIRVVRGPAA